MKKKENGKQTRTRRVVTEPLKKFKKGWSNNYAFHHRCVCLSNSHSFFFFFFCILFTFVVWTCFCFVVVNESCEKLASYGLLPNMIIYLTTFYHMEAASASVLIALWTALSNGLGLFGAFLSDSYLGRFRAVAIGTISSLIVSLSSPNFYFLISICSV